MTTNQTTGKYDLRRIAHDAMLQRGLLPDFSAEVLAQTDKITSAATGSGPEIRDLRHLLWASIDNDDSRDLDQLSVAQPLADGAVKILVAIADVDALVKKDSRSTAMRAPTRRRCTRPPRSFRCCRKSFRPTSRRWARARNGWRSSST